MEAAMLGAMMLGGKVGRACLTQVVRVAGVWREGTRGLDEMSMKVENG